MNPGFAAAPLWLTLAVPSVCFPAATLATPAADIPPPTPTQQQRWIDARYEGFTNSADRLAMWVDGFFSQTRAVEDAATSLIRVRPEYSWDDDDNGDWKVRVTGRLFLPAASDRLSLVFLGEDDDFDSQFYDPGITSDGSSTVGLQYRVTDRAQSRIDLTAALKSGPKGKLGGRYRFQLPLGERTRLRLSEEIFWIGGDGFGSLSRFDVDRSLDENTLLRWANKATISEASNGVEWSSVAAWIRRLDGDHALRAFAFIRGETDPRFLKTRGVGSSYRRRFLRDWLFWEVEPRYEWRKARAGENRDGVLGVDLRLEIVLGARKPRG